MTHAFSVSVVMCILNSVSASFTADLMVKTCDKNGCTPVQKRVALDATSNGTEKLISVGGKGQDELTLKYGGAAIGGPRVYLIEKAGVNENFLFKLGSKEFTFDVELSTMPCGFNAALYFVGMTANQGAAESGTNYCDAQAVDGTFCSEMDIMEANTKAQQYTTHACIDECASFTTDVAKCKGSGSPSTVCDQSGCGLNPFRYGPGTTYNSETSNPNWHGDKRDGKDYALDSSQVVTVVTQFHADAAVLSSITRFYVQNGKRVDLPTLYVKPPTDGSHYGGIEQPALTEDFCTDIYDRWTGGAGAAPLAQMGANMENGMVLAMSAWYAQETYVNGKPQGEQTGMSWLDGVNNWGKYVEAGPCHANTADDGTHQATFSNIRFGDIGTTIDAPPAPSPAPTPTPPSPKPPAPTPTPPSPTPPAPAPAGSGQCCYGGCGGKCQGGWCGQTQTQCEGNCNGKWCPSSVVV